MSCNISDIVADETLFQEIQRGDEKAFDVLFLKYYPSLCAYAQRFVEYDDGQVNCTGCDGLAVGESGDAYV